MGFFSHKRAGPVISRANSKNSSVSDDRGRRVIVEQPSNDQPRNTDAAANTQEKSTLTTDASKLPVTALAIVLSAVASIGGFMFGYESGQISGRFSQDHCRNTINMFQ